MKTFKNVCAQGDIYITRTDMQVPANAVEVQPEGNYLIITHSETGHHHVMEKTKAKLYKLPDDIMKCLLVVEDPVALQHLRDYDTHSPIQFEKGNYIVRRQREYTPEGFRKVQD
jgi:hypothetical protein